jgi:hypothetical protein
MNYNKKKKLTFKCLEMENNNQMIFFLFFKAQTREREDKPKTDTDPKPLCERKDSLESTGGSNTFKFTLNLDNKQKK